MPQSSTAAAAAASPSFRASSLFAALQRRLEHSKVRACISTPLSPTRPSQTGRTMVRSVGCVFHFIVTRGDARKSFTVDLASGAGRISEGAPRQGAPAGCTVHVSDADLAEIVEGKMAPEDAYLQGRVRLEGDAKCAPPLCVLCVACVCLQRRVRA